MNPWGRTGHAQDIAGKGASLGAMQQRGMWGVYMGASIGAHAHEGSSGCTKGDAIMACGSGVECKVQGGYILWERESVFWGTEGFWEGLPAWPSSHTPGLWGEPTMDLRAAKPMSPTESMAGMPGWHGPELSSEGAVIWCIPLPFHCHPCQYRCHTPQQVLPHLSNLGTCYIGWHIYWSGAALYAAQTTQHTSYTGCNDR